VLTKGEIAGQHISSEFPDHRVADPYNFSFHLPFSFPFFLPMEMEKVQENEKDVNESNDCAINGNIAESICEITAESVEI
jgi:hypothetical protein